MNSQDFGTNNDSGRDSWVRFNLKKLAPGLKLLDAGAGEQKYRDACSHLEYIAQDFGEYDGLGDKAGMHGFTNWDTSKNQITCDITSIPVEDGSFDVILCTEVFEHIPEPIKAIVEFSRILKTGGQLILTAPVCSLTHQSPYYFYNGFSKYFYEKFLPENGLTINELVQRGSYPEYIAQEIMRIPNIARRYSNLDTPQPVINVIRQLLIALYECLKNDKGSSELLCYGTMVIATKD